jgi:outer membrane protein assembly factor BamA
MGVVIGGVVAGWIAAGGLAADPQPSELLRGQVIREVVFRSAGDRREEELRGLADLEPGTLYRPSRIRRSIERLYQLGEFENVRVRAQPLADGVRLTFELPPRPRLTELRFVGTERVDERRLRTVLALGVGDPVWATDLPRLRTALRTALVRLGYRSASIGLGLDATDAKGGIRLTVRVALGPRTRIRELRFRGNTVLSRRALRRRLGVGPGDVLDLDQLEQRRSSLEQMYRRQNYYDVVVGEPEVRDVDQVAGPRALADVVIPVDAGRQVQLEIVGNRRLSRRVIEREARLFAERNTGDPVRREVRDRVRTQYRLRGHYKARVEIGVQDGREVRRIQIRIREGPVGWLGRIGFPGRHALERSELLDVVRDAVRRSLASVTGDPGADPVVLDAVLGGQPANRAAPRRAPDTTSPDADRIYVARAFRNAADALADTYRGRGYQQVDVGRPQVREREDGLIDVDFEVSEGIQWRVASVRSSGNVELNDRRLQRVVRQSAKVFAGAVLTFEALEEARRAVTEAYRDRGYLYVQVQSNAVAPDDPLGRRHPSVRSHCSQARREGAEVCRLDAVFSVVEGPRVRTGDVLVRGNDDTRTSVVRSEVDVTSREVLRASDLERSRENLLRVGVFDRVRVRPLNEERVESVKDVLVDLTERQRYALEIGGGASTEEGFRLFTGFSDSNLFGSAVRVRVDGQLNFLPNAFLVLYNEPVRSAIQDFFDTFTTLERLEYQLSAGISYPRIFGLPRGYAVGLDVVGLRNIDPAFVEDTQTINIAGSYTGFRPRLLGRRRQVSLQLRTGVSRTALLCNDGLSAAETTLAAACSDTFTPGDPAQFEGNNAYFSGGPRLSIDFRNDPLSPTSGAYFELEGELAKGLDAESPDLGQIQGRLSFYVPLLPRVVFSTALLGGRIFALQDEESVPVNRRFFAGGRTTVRGYQERTLLPQDVTIIASEEERQQAAEDLGGDSPEAVGIPPVGSPLGAISAGGLLFVALKAELTVQVWGPLGVAAFYDVGDLFESGSFSFETTTDLEDGTTVRRALAQGAGFGIRLATPVGPLALDVARPINVRDPGADDWQLHFAVGTF